MGPSRAKPMLVGSGDFDTSLSQEVRKYLRTYGLTPPSVENHETQISRCLKQLDSKKEPIEKYEYLSTLRNNNVHVFYRLVLAHLKDITPLIYTPVVGEAWLYLSYSDRGSIATLLNNWPQAHVEMTVVTDGSRILGLGDLGVNGMGIPVGKLALYTACAGIHPEGTLPLMLDFGTNNKENWEDPLYMGNKHEKITPDQEEEFLDELMAALTEKWPGIVIQFEDWKNPFHALERYRDTYVMFNDDVQGTGAVILAGVINAVRHTGKHVKEHRAVFMGAGSAGVGVAKEIVEFFVKEGLTEDEARRCFWLVDSKGLVTNDRGDKLADHKTYFARDDNDGKQYKTLEEVIEYVKPTMLMGLCTIGGIFTNKILTRMGELNDKPIIFPLSNPSTASECTFEDAMECTEGRALFASGSPFPDYEINGKVHSPGQGNNMYVFPGIGLGAIVSKAVSISQDMIYASAVALSTSLTDEEKSKGWLYPEVDRIRDVSVIVARGVIRAAQKGKYDRETHISNLNDEQLDEYIRERMYDPRVQKELAEKELSALVGSWQKAEQAHL
ncbi:MAG: hypothetical protein M1824_001523 [Vezdaea acicularis]|nr:MAG: hypothetical protein M1824_001523 [Vezdaea acicularis]